MSPLHRFPVRQVCTTAYQGLAWLFPGLYFVTPGEPVCCSPRRWPCQACWPVVLPHLFTIEVLTAVAMLLLARSALPFIPLQSYGFFMLWLKCRSDVIPRRTCLRLFFSHLQSSNFSWVILLYFHLIVWLQSLLRLLRWCLWAILLGLFFIETLSSVSKIYHLYSLFFVSSNLCDFVYLFQWSFMILFVFYICIILCAYF